MAYKKKAELEMELAQALARIEELEAELQELKAQPKDVQKIKNERGAGRKFKLSDKEIELILKDREFGTSIRNIAKLRGCSVGLVHKIISEHTKKEE